MNVKNKFPQYLFLLLKVLFGVFPFILLFACTQKEAILNPGESKIRIVNASPDNSIVSFFINDTLKTPQALNFLERTNYQTTSAGTHQVFTKVSGNEVNNSRTKFFFRNNYSYTIFVSGKISKDSLIYVSTEDNLTAPATSTKAKVRFINVSPNSASLEAVFSTVITDSVANFSNVNFRASSLYQEFTPGTYIIKIRKTGQKIALANGTNFSVSAGKIYTVWVKGLLNGTGDFALSARMLSDN